MKKYIKNLTCAPKSTILALFILGILTWLRVAKLIDNDVYNPVAPIVIGFAFSDILGENGKKKAKELTDKAKPKEDEDESSEKE